MQLTGEAKLDFAYKYPFSSEARDVVAASGEAGVNVKYLQAGFSRLENELQSGSVPGTRIRSLSSVKREYVMGYVYARMLVSAMGSDYAIAKFADAEAKAAKRSLELDSMENVLVILKELGLGAEMREGAFEMGVEGYVSVPKEDKGMKLVNQRLANGIVRLNKAELLSLLEGAIEKEIRGRLPIERLRLPRQVVELAKALKKYEPSASLTPGSKGTYAWIEKLLATPIADVRHRSVNIIFAPYLVNIRGIGVDEASKIIMDYIDKCKQINPNTKINETYVKYQCKYAKRKGTRPMSLARARELLKDTIDIG